MSERLKSVMSSAVIVSCLALLGFLVHEKTEGAAVGALAIVTTLVAWFTRQPDRKDPPAGVTVVLGLVLAGALYGCAASDLAKQLAAEREYKAQQVDCVRQYDSRELIDACRAKVRAEWGFADAGAEGGDR